MGRNHTCRGAEWLDSLFGGDAASDLGKQRADNPETSAGLPAPASTADAPVRDAATQASASVDRGSTFVRNPQLTLPQQAQHVLGDGGGTIRAGEPAGDEIVCQGSETAAIAHYAWAPDQAEVSLMYFNPARTPAGEDGSGLEPADAGT